MSDNDKGNTISECVKQENIVVAELPGLSDPNAQHFVLVENIKKNNQGEYEVILFDPGRQARCNKYMLLSSLGMRGIHYGNKLQIKKLVNN